MNFNDIKTFFLPKESYEQRFKKHGALYELFIKMIIRGFQENSVKFCFGFPNKELINTNENHYAVPVFYFIDNKWRKVFDIPNSLYLPMLVMIDEFVNQKIAHAKRENKPLDFDSNVFDIHVEKEIVSIALNKNELCNFEFTILAKSPIKNKWNIDLDSDKIKTSLLVLLIFVSGSWFWDKYLDLRELPFAIIYKVAIFFYLPLKLIDFIKSKSQ